MDIKKQQRAVVDALEDIKAQDIQVFNTEEITSLFDRVIIATANSNRQTRALASSVHDKARELGLTVIATEGTETGEWVLVDLGDVVVHIMQPAIRQYYNLEEIWGSKPVRMKLDSAPTKKSSTAKASSATASAQAPKKTTKTATKTARKTATKTPAKTTRKTTTTRTTKTPTAAKTTRSVKPKPKP